MIRKESKQQVGGKTVESIPCSVMPALGNPSVPCLLSSFPLSTLLLYAPCARLSVRVVLGEAIVAMRCANQQKGGDKRKRVVVLISSPCTSLFLHFSLF